MKHLKEQLFTAYVVVEFEHMFENKPVEWITATGTDGIPEPIEKREDFCIPDEDFDAFADRYLTFSEKRELSGSTNHLLYICRRT